MKIAISWCTEDIKSIRPHLSNDQCDEVLTRAQTTHDPNIGLNWEVFGDIADEMFPGILSKLRKWVIDPQQTKPGCSMPAMNLSAGTTAPVEIQP